MEGGEVTRYAISAIEECEDRRCAACGAAITVTWLEGYAVLSEEVRAATAALGMDAILMHNDCPNGADETPFLEIA